MSAERERGGRARARHRARPRRAREAGARYEAPRRRPLRTLLVVALAFASGLAASLLWTGPLRPSADAVVPGVAPVSLRIGAYGGPFSRAGHGVEIAPADGGADTLLILLPGGLVRPHAYTWIGAALAPIGVRTIVPAMPADLALLARERPTALLEHLREGERRVVLAGHSLGGVTAAGWAARHPGEVDALVLLAAYPAGDVDLSERDLPTLVLAAGNDARVSRAEIEASLRRLPSRTGIETIDGAIHSFFGRYGTGRGDGLPTVARGQAEEEIAGALEAFVVGLR